MKDQLGEILAQQGVGWETCWLSLARSIELIHTAPQFRFQQRSLSCGTIAIAHKAPSTPELRKAYSMGEWLKAAYHAVLGSVYFENLSQCGSPVWINSCEQRGNPQIELLHNCDPCTKTPRHQDNATID